MYHINNKNSVWQLYTDFIPVTNDMITRHLHRKS